MKILKIKIILLALFLCISFCNYCYAELKLIDNGQIMINNTNPLYDNMFASLTFTIKDNPLYKKNLKIQWYYNKENKTLIAFSPFGKNPLFKTYFEDNNNNVNISIYELYDEKTQKIFFAIKNNNDRNIFFILGFNGKGEYLEQLFHFKNIEAYAQYRNYSTSLGDNGIINIFDVNCNTNNIISYKYKLTWNNDKFIFDISYLGKETEKIQNMEYKPHKFNWYSVYKD